MLVKGVTGHCVWMIDLGQTWKHNTLAVWIVLVYQHNNLGMLQYRISTYINPNYSSTFLRCIYDSMWNFFFQVSFFGKLRGIRFDTDLSCIQPGECCVWNNILIWVVDGIFDWAVHEICWLCSFRTICVDSFFLNYFIDRHILFVSAKPNNLV